ncbi:molecular chaperone [Photorhabdus temperata]|uniref:P pilus assembly protein, chaperone PapD n=1 Tax=Photorhabdus temperata subsp. temperata Meg1 TaxID=1393735 RepID=A0A081S0P9_PHOTE|nr:molecular chaperone [Photorhabdus temperata]KER04502.1 P pilus assembly protein, chaperone PapD [Photorhabdus temperata subsp. temperata Meg1]MCT8346850.1 molecular chaperone [Photorhabdus temperata]
MQFQRLLTMIFVYIISINFAIAGVVIGGTRVIYMSDKKEASISINNPEKDAPYLIQSWIQDENENMKTPFIVTPPIFKLAAGQENILRIVKAESHLPEDRESLFWLNVKSIPTSVKSDQNQLQITVKSIFKLFYRPAHLAEKSSTAYKELKFRTENNLLIAENPTPYFISFSRLKIDQHEIKPAGMIKPFSQLSWTLPVKNIKQVTWKVINDFGGVTAEEKVTI